MMMIMIMVMMMKLMMAKICEYLQYLDHFTHIIKKERPAGKKNLIKYQRHSIKRNSASNHYCPLKAESKWNGVKLLENDSFPGLFFSKKKGTIELCIEKYTSKYYNIISISYLQIYSTIRIKITRKKIFLLKFLKI